MHRRHRVSTCFSAQKTAYRPQAIGGSIRTGDTDCLSQEHAVLAPDCLNERRRFCRDETQITFRQARELRWL